MTAIVLHWFCAMCHICPTFKEVAEVEYFIQSSYIFEFLRWDYCFLFLEFNVVEHCLFKLSAKQISPEIKCQMLMTKNVLSSLCLVLGHTISHFFKPDDSCNSISLSHYELLRTNNGKCFWHTHKCTINEITYKRKFVLLENLTQKNWQKDIKFSWTSLEIILEWISSSFTWSTVFQMVMNSCSGVKIEII